MDAQGGEQLHLRFDGDGSDAEEQGKSDRVEGGIRMRIMCKTQCTIGDHAILKGVAMDLLWNLNCQPKARAVAGWFVGTKANVNKRYRHAHKEVVASGH